METAAWLQTEEAQQKIGEEGSVRNLIVDILR